MAFELRFILVLFLFFNLRHRITKLPRQCSNLQSSSLVSQSAGGPHALLDFTYFCKSLLCFPGWTHMETSAPGPSPACRPQLAASACLCLRPPCSTQDHTGDTATRTPACRQTLRGCGERSTTHITVAGCYRPLGPFLPGDAEHRGLGSDIPDLDAPVQRDRSHFLAVGVKAACHDGPLVMACSQESGSLP